MKKVLGLFVTFFLFSCIVFAQNTKSTSEEIKEITSTEYYNSLQSKVTVVMFSMDKCGPCYVAKKKFLPGLVESLSKEDVGVYVLNMSHDEVTSDKENLPKVLSVDVAPTFMVVVNGTSVFTQPGFPTTDAVAQERIKDKIIKAVNKYK